MTKDKLINELKEKGFDLSIICWEPSARDDVFCLYNNGNEWTVYYQEHGKIFNKRLFKTESESIEYLFHKLL